MAPGLSCSMWDLVPMGTLSYGIWDLVPTRDGTQDPCIGSHGVLATGSSGKSQECPFLSILLYVVPEVLASIIMLRKTKRH